MSSAVWFSPPHSHVPAIVMLQWCKAERKRSTPDWQEPLNSLGNYSVSLAAHYCVTAQSLKALDLGHGSARERLRSPSYTDEE